MPATIVVPDLAFCLPVYTGSHISIVVNGHNVYAPLGFSMQGGSFYIKILFLHKDSCLKSKKKQKKQKHLTKNLNHRIIKRAIYLFFSFTYSLTLSFLLLWARHISVLPC